MVQPDPLDQYANFGWARWVALVFVVWGALTPLLVLWISGMVLLGLTPDPQASTQALVLWQVLPWLAVLAAYGMAGVRLVRRRPALNVWLLGFGLMACMALLNSTIDEAGRPFQDWPEAAPTLRLAGHADHRAGAAAGPVAHLDCRRTSSRPALKPFGQPLAVIGR